MSVKCKDCGYLSLRLLRTDTLVEACDEYRERAGFRPADGPSPTYDSIPLCFARKTNFRKETDILESISRERDCDDGFTKWQQGFTPKEHREMMDRKMMLDWQKEREEADKKWRETQIENEHRFRFWSVLLTGALMILAALVGAYISANR